MGFKEAFKTGANKAMRDAALRRGEKDKAVQAILKIYENYPNRTPSCELKDCVRCKP